VGSYLIFNLFLFGRCCGNQLPACNRYDVYPDHYKAERVLSNSGYYGSGLQLRTQIPLRVHFVHYLYCINYQNLSSNFNTKKWVMKVDIRLRAVAANIKERRDNLQLSQMYMASKLSITQNAYSKIEMAKTKMSIERLYEIAELLRIPARQLIDTAPKHPLSSLGYLSS
jgi:DNA-binding XRE family transcriptional regulator